MASAAARTLAKVKSSAMTPRQPSVPNLMTGSGISGPAFSSWFSLTTFPMFFFDECNQWIGCELTDSMAGFFGRGEAADSILRSGHLLACLKRAELFFRVITEHRRSFVAALLRMTARLGQDSGRCAAQVELEFHRSGAERDAADECGGGFGVGCRAEKRGATF